MSKMFNNALQRATVQTLADVQKPIFNKQYE